MNPIAPLRLPRRAGIPVLAVLVLAAAAGAGCGKKGPPEPPPRATPKAASDLAAAQRGGEWLFSFAYPQTTVSGTPLTALEAVELWRLRRPAPPAVEPAAALPAIDRREFAPAAELALRISGSELRSAIEGDRIRLRLPVGEVAPDGARMTDAFAVKLVAGPRDVSEFSNLLVLLAAAPPRPPGRLAARSEEGGVALAWEAVEGSSGSRVYRRDATARAFGAPLATVEQGVTSHLDRTVEVGRRYVYSVSSLGGGAPPVESASPVEQEIDYQDRFAPAPPRRPVALPDRGRIRLVWEASPAADVTGYVVFRATADEAEFRRVRPEPVTELEFLDSGLAAGVLHRYRVAAIDRVGNLGEPSEIVEAAPLAP